MDMLKVLPDVEPATVAASAPVFHFTHLELAPEGWMPLVKSMARGYVETIGEHDYCQECDGLIRGNDGHHIDCPTMTARRMLAEYQRLLACHQSALSAAPGVDIDRIHTLRQPQPAGQHALTGTDG